MTMKKFLVTLFLLAATLASQANDGVYYTSGNQLIPLTETNISVQKEVLTISLCDDHKARVDVSYQFYNPTGKAKKLLVGFEAPPSYNADGQVEMSGVHHYIHDFKVQVNGKSISYNTALSQPAKAGFKPFTSKSWKLSDDDGGFGYVLQNKADPSKKVDDYVHVYYFEAVFQPGINRVHHTYTYDMSFSVGVTFSFSYLLAPAARWANHRIDDFTLVIRADKTAKHFFVNQSPFKKGKFAVKKGAGKVRLVKGWEDEKFWEIYIRNGSVAWSQKNFVPTEDLDVISADIASNMPFIGDHAQGFGFFYDRGSSGYDGSRIQQFWGMEGNLDRKKFARIAHNLPYADRGHVFKDKEMKRFFESLWWYIPDPSYKDDTSDFTPNDWEYVRFK